MPKSIKRVFTFTLISMTIRLNVTSVCNISLARSHFHSDTLHLIIKRSCKDLLLENVTIVSTRYHPTSKCVLCNFVLIFLLKDWYLKHYHDMSCLMDYFIFRVIIKYSIIPGNVLPFVWWFLRRTLNNIWTTIQMSQIVA